MKVLLLGTAAGGGFPQWNCACRLCLAGRQNGAEIPARTQDCVAISATGRDWHLLNASPDIRAQLVGAPEIAPGPRPRETPLRGVLLTDAELDHCLGLAMLREGSGLRVHAPATVLHALHQDFALRPLLDHYTTWEWHETEPGVPFKLPDGLVVTAVPVSTKRPRYANGSTMDGHWVFAYRVSDPETGGLLVYAPCLAQWPEGFDDVVADADCVLVDGTFHHAAEMAGSTGDPSGQSAMGHLPVDGHGGSLPILEKLPHARRVYTHLNNTNPLLDANSAERGDLSRAGVEVLPDGTCFEL